MLVLLPILFACYISAHAEYTATCPKDQDCTWSYSYFLTQNFKCVENNQCPKGFLCCSDCHYQHHICKLASWVREKEVSKMECPTATTICKIKFPSVGTQKFKCTNDADCKQEFLCCADHCYDHKICKKGVEENICPKDLKICSRPLPFAKTKKYKCTAHSQCRKGRACCFDSCYSHKICKFQLDPLTSDENCPISIRREYCLRTNLTLSEYACKTVEDCVYGYKCCEDNCYTHKVCKLPNGAFDYREPYQPPTPKIQTFEEQHNMCPKVENKCSKPYSLRLAKKFICFKDEDCKLGQLCCKDSCVKDFKICKSIYSLTSQQAGLVKQLVLQTVETSTTSSKEETNLVLSKTTIPMESSYFDNQTLESELITSNMLLTTGLSLENEAGTNIEGFTIYGEGTETFNYKKSINLETFFLWNLTTLPSFNKLLPASIPPTSMTKKEKVPT